MKLLKEIFLAEDLDLEGRTIIREAVRGIINREEEMLLIHSQKNGDFKFPGGGIKVNEKHEEALAREVKEECGVHHVQILQPFGQVVEYKKPVEHGFQVFKMISFYYFCATEGEFLKQELDGYEKRLGFKPVWVEIDGAIRNNNAIINSSREKPRWIYRDTFVLEQVRDYLKGSIDHIQEEES